jgi:hypothetical protein
MGWLGLCTCFSDELLAFSDSSRKTARMRGCLVGLGVGVWAGRRWDPWNWEEEEHSDRDEDERDEERRDNDAGLHFTQPWAQKLGATAAEVVKANDSIANV